MRLFDVVFIRLGVIQLSCAPYGSARDADAVTLSNPSNFLDICCPISLISGCIHGQMVIIGLWVRRVIAGNCFFKINPGVFSGGVHPGNA
jgi:hypothetical protein